MMPTPAVSAGNREAATRKFDVGLGGFQEVGGRLLALGDDEGC